MKNILYSPKKIPSDDDMFFEQMTAAANAGGDILIFPENAHTPYDELLHGADILNPNDADYVLGSLYDFSAVTGCATVFSAVDLSGFPYAVFANALASDGDTFSKIYIKHDKTENLCAQDLADYDECRGEIFEPIVCRGFRIGLMLGGDVRLPKLFELYKNSGTEYIIHPTGVPQHIETPLPVVSCGVQGACALCGSQNAVNKIDDNLYEVNITKKMTAACAATKGKK